MLPFNEYAPFYDLLNKDKPYEKEVGFILEELDEQGVRPPFKVLELGCGTGKHLSLLAEQGCICKGVDASEEMIRLARERHPELKFKVQNIKALDVEGQYDVVLSLFHVMNYLGSTAALTQVMQKVASRLNDGGIFLFDSWYGPAVQHDQPTSRKKVFENSDMKIVRTSHPDHNVRERTVNVIFDFDIEGGTRFQEEHFMRYYFTNEIENAILAAGLELVETKEWMTGDPLTEDTWYATYIVRK